MNRLGRAVVFLGLCCAGPAAADCSKLEVREGYQPITASAFSKLPPDTPEGRKFTIHHLRFLKIWGEELKVLGGFQDGQAVASPVQGLLVIEDRATRRKLIANLKANKDSDDNPLVSKKSNVQVFGVGVRVPDKGYLLSVNRVVLVDDFPEHFDELYRGLPASDAQARVDLLAEIKELARPFPQEAKALEPLVAKLKREAQDLERSQLPELPGGAQEHIRFGRRHEEISVLAAVTRNEQVSEADRELAAKVLREEIGARSYLGEWLSYDAFKQRLGFQQTDEGAWLPKERLELLAAAEAEKLRRKQFLVKPSVDRRLLELAMKSGDVIGGMDKAMVVAARQGFPAKVDRVHETVGSVKLTWELWIMTDGMRVYLCNGFVFQKEEPAKENGK